MEASAANGNADAIALLAAAEAPPDALAYLADIFAELDMMRSYDSTGNPQAFTPTHIMAGAQLFRWALEPQEVRALVLLDRVTLSPHPIHDRQPAAASLQPNRDSVSPWPDKATRPRRQLTDAQREWWDQRGRGDG